MGPFSRDYGTLLQREAIIAADETEKHTDIRVILAYAHG